MRVSKYENTFAKNYTPNWSEEMFVINVKNTVLLTCVIEDLNSEEVVEMLYEQELKKTNKTKFRIEKVIKKKSDYLYISSGKAVIILLIAW